MAKVVNQSIPAELTEAYDESLHRAAVWIPGSSIRQVRHRVPFRLPHMQNKSMHTPSAAQRIVRQAFKNCTICFGKQPDSGGATPPDPGPRNRSWWYNESLGSGLFYYDYFIQQTFAGFYTGPTPEWCIIGTLTPFAHNRVKENDPNTTESGSGKRAATWISPNYQWWIFHQFDLTEESLQATISGYYYGIVQAAILHFTIYNVYLYWDDLGGWFMRTGRLYVHQIDYWDPSTLTWNNKPDLPPETFHRTAYMQSGPYGDWNQNETEHWLDISDLVIQAINADSKYLTVVFRVSPIIPNYSYPVDPDWYLSTSSGYAPPEIYFL